MTLFSILFAATLATFLNEEYGVRPVERPADLSFAELEPDAVMMDGAAVRKRVTIGYGGKYGRGSFTATAFVPRTEGQHPAFLFICNRDPKENIDPTRTKKSGFWPAEEIVARGYAAVTFYNGEVAEDGPGFTNGVFRVFERPEERTTTSWGVLSAWAWGASRVLDWLETIPEIDARRVAVVGHSRGGKTALLAGVSDSRFAMACVNDSGCGGVKLNAADLPKSEHIADITYSYPFWFCANFRKYAGKDASMPFDQDGFLALMAPRPVAIGSATLDTWAGAEGEFECARRASKAWEAVGKKGLVGETFPKPDTALQDGMISFHSRTGNHDLTLDDWKFYIDFADRRMK